MKLDPAEKSRVWWHGALKGMLKGAAVGLVIGVGAALVIWGAAVAFPSLGLASAFSGFLFNNAAGAALSVNLVPFAAFNIAFGMIGGLCSGGNAAVHAYHQQKHNLRDEAKLVELDGRMQQLEQAIAPSRTVSEIIARGPKPSFAEAETARQENALSAPTFH